MVQKQVAVYLAYGQSSLIPALDHKTHKNRFCIILHLPTQAPAFHTSVYMVGAQHMCIGWIPAE